MADKYTFKVFRFDPEKDKAPYYKSYEVPYRQGMTVLEGIAYIQDYIDGTLAAKYSCREAVCGSCAMHINGKYRLACNTQIIALKSNTITVAPLRHLPVVKDLFVDLTNFWAKWEYIRPYLMPQNPNPKTAERLQTTDARANLDGLVDCILCASCHNSCTVTEQDPEYLGPAALLWADRFFTDSRDNAWDERLELVDTHHGVWRCHTIVNCQEVCPKHLDPTGAIAHLKRHLTLQKLGLEPLVRGVKK